MYRKSLLIIPFMIMTISSATAGGVWLSREFIDSWNDPASGFEVLLNTECRPLGLDGIQVFAVQKGHGSAFNLHVSCRQDGAAAVRYSVRMLKVPRGHLDELVSPLVSNPRLRIASFYFGKVEGPESIDGLLLIEKVR